MTSSTAEKKTRRIKQINNTRRNETIFSVVPLSCSIYSHVLLKKMLKLVAQQVLTVWFRILKCTLNGGTSDRQHGQVEHYQTYPLNVFPSLRLPHLVNDVAMNYTCFKMRQGHERYCCGRTKPHVSQSRPLLQLQRLLQQ